MNLRWAKESILLSDWLGSQETRIRDDLQPIRCTCYVFCCASTRNESRTGTVGIPTMTTMVVVVVTSPFPSPLLHAPSVHLSLSRTIGRPTDRTNGSVPSPCSSFELPHVETHLKRNTIPHPSLLLVHPLGLTRLVHPLGHNRNSSRSCRRWFQRMTLVQRLQEAVRVQANSKHREKLRGRDLHRRSNLRRHRQSHP